MRHVAQMTSPACASLYEKVSVPRLYPFPALKRALIARSGFGLSGSRIHETINYSRAHLLLQPENVPLPSVQKGVFPCQCLSPRSPQTLRSEERRVGKECRSRMAPFEVIK